MADLRLTVDISALTAAQAIVKKMDGKVLNLTFRTKGLNDINSIKKSLSGISGASKTSAQDVSRVAASFDNLGSAIKKSNTVSSDGSTRNVAKYNAELGKTVTITEKVNAAKKKSTSATVTQVDAAELESKNIGKQKDLLAKIETIQTQRLSKYANNTALSGLADDLKKVDTASVDFEKSYARINQSVKGYETQAKGAKYAQDQLTQANKKNLLSVDNIKESMGTAAIRTVEWAATMGILYGAVNAVRSMVTTSTAINDQMNRIQMVTGASSGETQKLLVNYQNIATELSSTTSAVAASAEVWLRQGRTIADTNKLIETSTVLSKVGFMDSATSAQMLTSAINGYKISAEDAMSVVDKMSAIDVAAATSTEDLAIAMSKTASGAKIAGVSMDELLSYIATIVDVSQAAPETVGNSLKTIFARVNNVKMGSLTDEEGGDISNVETVLKQYGITLRETNGIARDTGDIFDELGNKWSTLNGLQKSEIATQIAGVRQKEAFLVLMENYDKALNLQAVSMKSTGSALQKMSIWEESTEAATQRLSNQWEILSTTMVDSGFTKAIINLGTLSLSALSSDLGQIVVKGLAVAATLVAIDMAKNKISKGWTAIDTASDTGLISKIKTIVEAQKVYKAGLAGMKTSTEAFASSTLAAKVATDGLLVALTPIAIAVAAIAAAAVGIHILDEAITTAAEHAENFDKLASSTSDNNSEISTLEQKLAEVQSRLTEINSMDTSLVDASEVTKLNQMTEQLNLQISALEQINKLNGMQQETEAMGALTKTDAHLTQKSQELNPSGLAYLNETISEPEYAREQIQLVEETEQKISALNEAYKNGSKSPQQYNAELKKLTETQAEHSLNANESALALNKYAESIDGSTDEERAMLQTIKEVNKALEDSNKLTDDSVNSKKEGSIYKGLFDGASPQDFGMYANLIGGITSGLESGFTNTENFKTSMAGLFGETPPDNITEWLAQNSALFVENEDGSSGFLDSMERFKDVDSLGNVTYKLGEMQETLGLSGEAMATINQRLVEMGLVIPTALGGSSIDKIGQMGDGIGLAAEEAVNFESKLQKIYGGLEELGAGKTLNAGNSIIDSLLISDDKKSLLKQNWKSTIEGLSEDTVTAFSGLQGETKAAIDQAIGSTTDSWLGSVQETFSRSGSIKLTGLFDTTDLDNSVRDSLHKSGLYTDEQIDAYVEYISGQEIKLRLMGSVEIALGTSLDGLGAEQKATIMQSIQDNLNTETGVVNIENVTATLNALNITGDPQARIIEALNLSNKTVPIEITAETKVAAAATDALTKPEEKSLLVKAETGIAEANLNRVQNSLSSLNNKSVQVTVNYVATGSAQAMADSGGSSSSTDVFVSGNQGSATGRININTASFGTESLIGEEGEETLIRDGSVSFIGTSGAEIIPVRDGDTILPADITKRIKSGQIPMYADGKYSVSVSNSPANTDWYVNQRNNSSIWAGLAGDAPEDDEAKKAYEAHIKSFQKEYDYYKHLLDMGEMDEKDYYAKVNSLNDQYFKGKNEYLDKYRDHEKEVHDFLKKQEEERLKTLEKNYSSSSSYILDMLDDQIDSLKEQEELAEKQEKIDKLKGNKNQRVYYEGRGWVWEEDKTAIAEAEKDMKDDSASAKLQEYRDKWAEIADNYENEQNKLEAIALLGDDFEKKVLDGDLAILRDFATKYSKVLGDVSNNEGDTSVPLLDYAKAWEEDEIKRLMGSESTGGILTAALNNNLSGLTTSAISSAQSSSNDNSINLYGDIKLENATDFDSFITEAKHYARVNSPKR